MKTDFSISVQVSVGVTPEVAALVTAILARSTVKAPAVAVTEPQAQPEQGQEQAGTAAGEQPKPEPVAEQQAQATPAAGLEAPGEPTLADVREAMHRARQRIEGEDYKEHAESEAYKKYHRALTREFKNIAALLGTDKPSQLPAEQRQAFIDECEQLKVLMDGTIGKDDIPF